MKPKMLQVCNVMWRGGTMLFAKDIVKAFPHFRHVVFYIHNSNVDQLVANELLELGAEVYHTPKLTDTLLKKQSPFITILHGLGGKAYEGKWPHKWLNKYPTIGFHHTAVRPWQPVDHEIFVSEYVKSRYSNLLDRVKGGDVIPPCIDTDTYDLPRSQDMYTHVLLILGKDKRKFTREFVDKVVQACKDELLLPRVKIVGGKHNFPDIKDPTVSNDDFYPDLSLVYSAHDILVYFPDIPDSCPRVIFEAFAAGCCVVAGGERGGMRSQLEGAPTGFFVRNLDELGCALRNAKTFMSHNKSFSKLSQQHAKATASYDVLRAKLLPIIMKVGFEKSVPQSVAKEEPAAATNYVKKEDDKYSFIYAKGYGQGPVKACWDWGKKFVTSNHRILDCGCGHAVLSGLASYDCYTGLDIASFQIKKLQALNKPKCTFVHSDVGNIHLPSNSHDLVFSTDMLEHLPEGRVDQALSEMAKVCNGNLLLTICCRSSNEDTYLPQSSLSMLHALGEKLHLTVKPKKWWLEQIENHCEVKETMYSNSTLYVYGRVK